MQPTPSGSDPTPAPTPGSAAPTAADPVVEFIRTDRQTAGYVLLGLATLMLVLCGWAVLKTTRPATATEPETQKKSEDPFALDELPTKPKDPARNDYIVGAILSGAGFLTLAAAAAWLLVYIPPTTEGKQRAEARALILGVGGLFGAILIVSGMWFFIRWSGSLTEWLDKGKDKEAKWALYPLLMIVVGGALMFLSAQPARAEERNNRALRRLVYGANMGLAVLLLFVGLIVFNLFLSPRLPNKLDVTETGFYSLSAGSTEALGRLDQPVTAYAVLVEGGRSDDIRRLLNNCQDASKGRFQAKFISPVSNRSEYRTLAGKYPVMEANETGVLLTIGDDEKRHTFIREEEFTARDQRDPMSPPTQDSGRSFVGEERLMRELLFLSENEKKAVVYFTQSAGELSLEPDPQLPDPALATRLRAFLERNYLEVKPLKFDPAAPKVPEDAAVLVVAEPTSPLSDAQVKAIRQYMTEPRPDRKKGKLIILASARFGPNGKVMRTGLEELLREFGVVLGDRIVMSEETKELDDPFLAIVMFAPSAVKARHPVAVALGEKTIFGAPNWRPVAALREGPPTYRALPLLITLPGRTTWLEEERPRDLNRIFTELNTIGAVRQAKQLTDNARPVGVVVSEGDSGRLAVFGNGLIISDGIVRQSRGGESGDPTTYDLMGGTVDWLRDRPPVAFAIERKKYKTFTLPASADETRGLWFPLLFSLMVVTGMGASVWIIRRRAA